MDQASHDLRVSLQGKSKVHSVLLFNTSLVSFPDLTNYSLLAPFKIR